MVEWQLWLTWGQCMFVGPCAEVLDRHMQHRAAFKNSAWPEPCRFLQQQWCHAMHCVCLVSHGLCNGLMSV
jgi:hypothetical protein